MVDQNQSPSPITTQNFPPSQPAGPTIDPAANYSQASTRRPGRKKRWFIGIGAGLVLLIGVSAILPSDDLTSVDSFSKNSPYEYTKPELNIDPGHSFSLFVSYDPQKLPSYKKHADFSDAVAVYNDAALTHPILTDFYYDGTNIKISPPSLGINTFTILHTDAPVVTKADAWGLYDQYYIVQKLDEDGKPRKKPLVTHFTVKQELPAPSVSFGVDDKGVGQFSWAPVSGAKKYYILKFSQDARDTHPQIQLIGYTTNMHWATTEQETDQTGIRGHILGENSSFIAFEQSEDELHGATSRAGGAGTKSTQYGVMAVSDHALSSVAPLDGDQLQAQLPLWVADNAMHERGADQVDSFDQIPAQMPITMANGTTVLRPVVIQPEKIKKVRIQVNNLAPVIKLEVPYAVQGTLLTNAFYLSQYSDATYKTEAARIVARNQDTQTKTGASNPYRYAGQKRDLANATISKSAPKTPYKINATNPLTAYIAANMLNGVEYMDLNALRKANPNINVYDAADEAIYQNQYILGVEDYYFYRDEGILEVHYNITSDERAKEQKEVADEVKRVVASVITKGMSDRQKAQALNDYLARTVSYNYEALAASRLTFFSVPNNYKRTWTPAGALIDKKGVCGTYSYAFKVLADAAGLQSVVVTGLLNGENHAWNKVKMDGKWQNLDVAWDDDPAHPNQYFGLTDKQMSATRTQDVFFILDPLISQYAAN